MTAVPIEVEEHQVCAVVRLHADLDVVVTERLRAALDSAGQRGVDIVLDLGDAAVIDPAALSLLVRAHRRARAADRLICLAAPSRYIVTVLHTMRVAGLFPIFSDVDAAVTWLRRKAA